MAKKQKSTKLSKTQQKILDILASDRNYTKLRQKTGLESKRIKQIREGKGEKPSRSEISKISHYQVEGISPESLSKYSGFSTKQIKQKMHPKLKSNDINKLKRKDGKYVIARKKNGQDVYYYVIFTIDLRTGSVNPGHGFMAKENVEVMLSSKGDFIHEVHYGKSGEPYSETYLIFNVLTFKYLARMVKEKEVFYWPMER